MSRNRDSSGNSHRLRLCVYWYRGIPNERSHNAETQTPAPTGPEAFTRRDGSSAGHFPVEVQTQLKIMAAEEHVTVQALLGEALDLLFAKRRKPQIASKSRERSQR